MQLSRKIDAKVAFRLAAIPAGPGGQNSLPALNLLRGWRLGLPSGQSIARKMGLEPVHNPQGHDPLWLYILKEAEERHDGERLGDVGSTIVAEVFLGLLTDDPLSYLNIEPAWEPKKERVVRIADPQHDDFHLVDILRFAGMPITSDDIHARLA